MPTPLLSEEAIREAIDAVASHGSQNKAAQALGIARATLQHRLREAARRGIAPEDLGREVELIGIMMQRRT